MGEHQLNTPLYGNQLRDRFRITEDVPLILEGVVVPVYNLAPPDLVFHCMVTGMGGIADITEISEPSVWSNSHFEANNTDAAYYQVMFDHIPAGMPVKFRIQRSGTPGNAANDNMLIAVRNAATSDILMVLVQDAMQNFNSVEIVETGWLKFDVEAELALAGVFHAAYFAVTAQMYALPREL